MKTSTLQFDDRLLTAASTRIKPESNQNKKSNDIKLLSGRKVHTQSRVTSEAHASVKSGLVKRSDPLFILFQAPSSERYNAVLPLESGEGRNVGKGVPHGPRNGRNQALPAYKPVGNKTLI